MKELRFPSEDQYEAAVDLQIEMRKLKPLNFKPRPKAVVIMNQEAEEFLSILETAGIEYEVAQDTDTPDSHFLV